METTAETLLVERELTIAAKPETVWEFLVDADKLARWMCTSASLDPRPGGLYQVEVISGNIARGEFVEVDPPRRLVFTWGWEPGGMDTDVASGSSTVEFDLEPTAEGTTLRFTHSGLPSTKALESHAHGWDHYLARLSVAASGGDPGPDPWLSRQA
jgi:uncharacterized protein YndB with AHSA1/START domain